mgnify:CR=1 FL=1
MGWSLLKPNRWKDPDYRVRLDFAQRSKNQSKLLHLALNDVHEQVRVSAVKNLQSDADLLSVVTHSSCEKSVTIAAGMIQSAEALCQVALIQDLAFDLRMDAIRRVEGNFDEVFLKLASDASEELSLYAISRCGDIRGLEKAYFEEMSDARARSIIEKSNNPEFCRGIFENSTNPGRRICVIMKIADPEYLRDAYLKETESVVRSAIIDRIEDNKILSEFFEDEDDEDARVKIVEKISDTEKLFSVACDDYNIDVRRAAVRAIKDPAKLARIAIENEDAVIQETVFDGDLSDDHLYSIVKEASSHSVRCEAIARVEDVSLLQKLAEESILPDVVWFCSRRLGKLPISTLKQIDSDEILVRAARQETQKIARVAAIRGIKDKFLVNCLKDSGDAELSAVAEALGKEVEGPLGLRFLQVPNRAYQMSVFPVTGEQFAQWKEDSGDRAAAKRYAELRDFPATNVSPDEAQEFCNWLSERDKVRYRIPYFDEWKHAAVCDSPDWFSTGRLRALRDQEEVEMILFGQLHSARPLHEAVPNPWGFLDTIGNILEWTNDKIYSERELRAGIAVDAFAQTPDENRGAVRLGDFAYASGNHWADRRIRPGRWKRLIHRENLDGKASGKIGFRVLRFDLSTGIEPLEYELTLMPEVKHGYSTDQVCRGVSQSILSDFESIKKRFTVAPVRLGVFRDYAAALRLKESWESSGAQVELTSRPIRQVSVSDGEKL